MCGTLNLNKNKHLKNNEMYTTLETDLLFL